MISGDPLLLGDSTADKFVALENLVKTQLDAIAADLTSLNMHSHGGIEPGTGTSGPSPSCSYTSASSVAATKVKAK